MTYKVTQRLIAGTFAAALALASPAFAFHGGGGGHMGGSFGGRMGGGMRFGGFGGAPHVAAIGAGPRFGTFGGRHFVGSRFASGRFAHAAVRPGFSRFGFHDRFAFRHRRFRRFASFGAPFFFAADYAYDRCWRRVWTRFGSEVVNVCYGDYGYY